MGGQEHRPWTKCEQMGEGRRKRAGGVRGVVRVGVESEPER